MRNTIIITLMSLVILIFAGCSNTLVQPNTDGNFTFNIRSQEFTITPGSRTWTTQIHNPTSIWSAINVKISDGYEGRHGVWVHVGAHETEHYDEKYDWGWELRIEIHRDGINTVNYIVLGDASNGSGKIVVIMNSCDETCDHNHTGEVASITEWFNSQNWSTYYSTTDSKQTEIVIRTADTELINAIRSGKDSVGNNNSEVIVKKVSLKSGVFDDIKDPGVDTNDIDSADFIEIEISTK